MNKTKVKKIIVLLIGFLVLMLSCSSSTAAEGKTFLSVSEVENLVIVFQEGVGTASFQYQGMDYSDIVFLDGMLILDNYQVEIEAKKDIKEINTIVLRWIFPPFFLLIMFTILREIYDSIERSF